MHGGRVYILWRDTSKCLDIYRNDGVYASNSVSNESSEAVCESWKRKVRQDLDISLSRR